LPEGVHGGSELVEWAEQVQVYRVGRVRINVAPQPDTDCLGRPCDSVAGHGHPGIKASRPVAGVSGRSALRA